MNIVPVWKTISNCIHPPWKMFRGDGSEKPPGEGNNLAIECVDKEIKIWVNGDLVNYGYDCTANRGQIALQAEGLEEKFRKLRIDP